MLPALGGVKSLTALPYVAYYCYALWSPPPPSFVAVMRYFQSALLLVLASAQWTSALYFYLDQGTRKCFVEDVPRDTVVVGHYMAEEWSKQAGQFEVQTDLGMNILIEAVETREVITSVRAPIEGKFAFTSHQDGGHEVCMWVDYAGSDRPEHGQIRLHLDIVLGDAKPDHSAGNKEHVGTLLERVSNLNALVRDIRREQRYQRERESEYRALSDRTNARAVYWSAAQLVVLSAACVWQLANLRRFFDRKKLR